MNIHGEAFPPEPHAIESVVRRASVWRCAPWAASAYGVWGQTGKTGLRAQGVATVAAEKNVPGEARMRHWSWADSYFLDPWLHKKWQPGDAYAPRGPTPTELAIGVYKNALPSSKLVDLLDSAAAVPRKAGTIHDGIHYIDAEPGFNSDNREKFETNDNPDWKAGWDLLRQLTPGESDDERDVRVRVAIYTQLTCVARCLGIPAENILVYGCADRATTFQEDWRPALAFPYHLPRNYIPATSPELLTRMLDGGSGPETCVVNFNATEAPEINRIMLDICKAKKVPDAILFADGSAENLTAQLPVFRDFVNA